MNRPWQLAFSVSFFFLHVCSITRAAEWKPLKAETPNKQASPNPSQIRWNTFEAESHPASQPPHWDEIETGTDQVLPKAVKWTPVESNEAADIEEKIERKVPIQNPSNLMVVIQPPPIFSGTTFANDKAIWRDDQWHPQISGTVPIGFGPKGLMINTSIWAIDCVTGAGYCAKTSSFDEYRNQFESLGEAQYNLSIGLGDTEKFAGLTITSRFEETSLPIGKRNKSDDKNIFSNYYIGAHLSRSIGPDTAVKVGIDNWLDIRDCVNCGFAKSAYGVISQRFRLKENQNSIFPNLYLTLGIGNGQFRPLEELVLDGIRKQKAAGCATPGFSPEKRCSQEALTRSSLRARSYGQINPIGSIALETLPGINMIGEWSGRNLNAGFSIRPFEDLGFVFTGMWENVLPNCDYGCTVSVPGLPAGLDLMTSLPDALTQRARFSLQASLEMKF